ncbi:hypothetical protein [Streptomyces sp. NPDC007074]|uniref:hypothetical protein n=1 Tax=Streptomyces sp. NPDC007074 TaxID=3156764 RepID=UPI0033D5BFAA
MTTALEDLAVRGRRVELALLRDKDNYLPGIITNVTTDQAALWVRLDGKRCNLPVRADHEYLRYLDEVVDVPDLPMGPFTPGEADMAGVWAGVPLAAIGEDGEALVLLTDDRDKAVQAATAYDREIGVDIHYVDYDQMAARWAVFTWEPEDAEFAWTIRWDVQESDDHAIRVHYLPAA